MFCFFNDTATTEIYTLSLHDALPICFTGDVLFKGTVGGTFAPGATGYADLKASVMRLVDLPPETVLHPGHREPTTAGEERENNPFVRIWTGVDSEGEETCSVWDREATLVLWADR